MRQLYTQRIDGNSSAGEISSLQQTSAAKKVSNEKIEARAKMGLKLFNNLLAKMQGVKYSDDLNPNAFGVSSFDAKGFGPSFESKVGVLFESDAEPGFIALKEYLHKHGIEYTEYKGLGSNVGLTIRNDYTSQERGLDKLIETLEKENLPEVPRDPKKLEEATNRLEEFLYKYKRSDIDIFYKNAK